jgi:DUF1365 family protein
MLDRILNERRLLDYFSELPVKKKTSLDRAIYISFLNLLQLGYLPVAFLKLSEFYSLGFKLTNYLIDQTNISMSNSELDFMNKLGDDRPKTIKQRSILVDELIGIKIQSSRDNRYAFFLSLLKQERNSFDSLILMAQISNFLCKLLGTELRFKFYKLTVDRFMRMYRDKNTRKLLIEFEEDNTFNF